MAEQSPCVTLEGQPVIRLSQIELADQYGSSPATVFAMLHTLQKAGCIQPYRRKSGYIVTGTGRARNRANGTNSGVGGPGSHGTRTLTAWRLWVNGRAMRRRENRPADNR